jgi:DNA-binding transcriptional MocR family regulator
LTELKVSTDYHGAMLPQYLAQRWLASGAHDHHVRRINKVYRDRAAAMVDALERRLDDEAMVVAPRGGHHVWLVFRRPLDERQLSAEALRQGVSFTPGEATTVAGSGECALRLSFSLLDEERIDEGVRRLAAAVRAVRRTSGSRFSAAIS